MKNLGFYNTANILANQPWHQYNHTLVRDLCWIIFKPLLLSEEHQRSIAPAFHPVEPCELSKAVKWLDTLDALSEQQLHEHTFDRSDYKRIGLYAEQLLATVLKQRFSSYSTALRNGQLSKKGITQGELDFVLKSRRPNISKPYLHVEMAIKFYLIDTNTSQPTPADCIGPNAADRMDLKLNRLKTHQLIQSQTPLGETMLQQHDIDINAMSQPAQLFLKGSLYRHVSAKNDIDCDTLWLRLQELAEYLESNDSLQWRIMKKMDWLAGPKVNNESVDGVIDKERCETKCKTLNEALAKESLLKKIADCYLPIQLEQVNPDLPFPQKSRRIMVVQDNWPEK